MVRYEFNNKEWMTFQLFEKKKDILAWDKQHFARKKNAIAGICLEHPHF